MVFKRNHVIFLKYTNLKELGRKMKNASVSRYLIAKVKVKTEARFHKMNKRDSIHKTQ